MSSWRDSASQEAQDDLDRLLNATLPFAEQMVGKYGEFYPFAASLGTDGEATMVAGDPGQGDHPDSHSVLTTLVNGFRARRDELRAIALVADVRVDDGDGIRVELEHREGHALAVLLPYKKKRFGRGVEYGPMRAGAAPRQVWQIE